MAELFSLSFLKHDKAAFAGLAARPTKVNFMSHTRREPSEIKYGLNCATTEKCGFEKERKTSPLSCEQV